MPLVSDDPIAVIGAVRARPLAPRAIRPSGSSIRALICMLWCGRHKSRRNVPHNVEMF